MHLCKFYVKLHALKLTLGEKDEETRSFTFINMCM
jgi:hypothetical protein